MATTVRDALSASIPARLAGKSLGKKFLMAATGVIAFGYVVGHMIGNLQIFLGQDQINSYAEFLHSTGAMLWLVRAVLLGSFVVHIWLGTQLKLENMSARPDPYQSKKYQRASLASRTMIWTGVVVLAFVIYHVLHFTVQSTNPEFRELIDPIGRPDVYSMVIIGFSHYVVSAFYLIAVGLLCYHLSHGIASMFQSLGFNNLRVQTRLEQLGNVIAVLTFLGYAAIPTAVMTGLLTLPEGVM